MMGHTDPQAMEARGQHSQNDGAWDHLNLVSSAMIHTIQPGNPESHEYVWLYPR
jgi:hypothetical protein